MAARQGNRGRNLNIATTSAPRVPQPEEDPLSERRHAAIPLAEMISEPADNLLVLMDSADHAVEIRADGASPGHVPNIDHNPRCSTERKQERRRAATAWRAIGHEYSGSRRFRERTTAERVNASPRGEFGRRHLRVRGHGNAVRHLMLGILARSVSHLLRLQIRARMGSLPVPPPPGAPRTGDLCPYGKDKSETVPNCPRGIPGRRDKPPLQPAIVTNRYKTCALRGIRLPIHESLARASL